MTNIEVLKRLYDKVNNLRRQSIANANELEKYNRDAISIREQIQAAFVCDVILAEISKIKKEVELG